MMGWRFGIALATAIALTGAADAQDSTAARAKPAKRPPARKVLRPEELKVEGNVQRPKAAAITPPNIDLGESRGRDESLLPKIIDALEKEPFRVPERGDR